MPVWQANLSAGNSGMLGFVLNRGPIRTLSLPVLIACLCCAGPSPELREGRLGTREEGMASFYSPRLAGHRTANGERYDPSKLTAAHPVIPLGTYVQVTRTDGSHRSVVVRINDRCAGRRKIIEVSHAAARQLDMLKAGLVPVELEIVVLPKH
jgi:rare lipoprotein A